MTDTNLPPSFDENPGTGEHKRSDSGVSVTNDGQLTPNDPTEESLIDDDSLPSGGDRSTGAAVAAEDAGAYDIEGPNFSGAAPDLQSKATPHGEGQP